MPGTYQYDVEIKSNVAKLLSDMKQVQDRLDAVEGKEYKIKLNVDEKKLSSVISNLEKMLDSLGKGTGDFKQFENLSKELSNIVSEVQSLSKAFGKVDDSGAKTLLSSIQNIDKSLSELSQNILNVNKNMSNMGGNTSGAVKQVENITNESKKAASALEDVAKAQEKVNGQKTNISSGVENSTINIYNNVVDRLTKILELRQKIAQSPTLENGLEGKGEFLKFAEQYKWSPYKDAGFLGESNIKAGYGIYTKAQTKFAKGEVDETYVNNAYTTFVKILTDNLIHSASGITTGKADVDYIKQRLQEMLPKKMSSFIDEYLDSITSFSKRNAEYNSGGNYIDEESKALKELIGLGSGINQRAEDIFTIDAKDDLQNLFDKTKISAENFQSVLESVCNILGIEIPQNTEKAKESIKEVATTASQDQTKDAFPKTSENLEQITQSEQKVQQEAVATDKALDNISFTPNTEGFDDIIAKFGILREQAEQITKIVKTTKQTADGTPNISYKATLRNGSSYYLGENSTPQVLNASETVYDAKADNAKKLEREKQIWNELTTSLDRYATLQKRIASNNALSTDNEEATKLLEHIHELQRNDILPAEKLTVSNEKLQQINQTVTDLKAKLKESTLDSLQGSIDKYQKIYDQRNTYSSDFTPSEQYTKNLTELNTAIKNLVEYRNTLKNVSEVTAEQEAELKELVTACEKASDSFKSLSASEKGASQIAVDKLVQRINKDLDECTNYSKEAKLGLRALRDELESANPRNLKEITSEIINIENAEIRAGRAGRSFFDTLKNSGFHQLAAQMAGMFGFYDVINLGKEAISTIVSLDDALVDLKKTTAMNSTQLEDFYYDANDVAKQMGVTTEEIITQASAWSRLGYSSQEAATTMAKLSSKFASISPGMSTDEAQEGLVSIMKAFDIDPDDVETEIMDKVNVLGNKFAEENQDVIEGLKRSAAAMSAMGQSFTDTAALFTGGMEILQDSESMGTALRTLSMRVRGYDEETNQLSDDLVNVTGEVADLTKTAQDSQGVSLFTDATQEHYRSMVEYLGDIADRWDQISEKNQTELLQKLFGKNRANAGAAIIQNFDQVRAAIEAMDESAGSSEAEMSAIESSLSYKINALKETWVGCVQDMIDRGDLGTIVTGLTKVSEVITFLLDKLGILGTIGLGAGIFSGIKNVGRDKMYSLSF